MDPTLAAQWAPKGCQPQLFSASTRERVNLCGIVDIDTMDAMVQKIPKGNAESFIAFLQWVTDIYPKELLKNNLYRVDGQGILPA